jgi:hypothetical protein
VTRDVNGSAGNYVKSVCTVYQDMTYDNAVASCTSNGMKILNSNSADVENFMISYSNVQWPYGSFWTEGKNGTGCLSFSNDKRLTYYKTMATCTNSAYFHCEYQGKLSF